VRIDRFGSAADELIRSVQTRELYSYNEMTIYDLRCEM
jgi:hypothetical protein